VKELKGRGVHNTGSVRQPFQSRKMYHPERSLQSEIKRKCMIKKRKKKKKRVESPQDRDNPARVNFSWLVAVTKLTKGNKKS